MNKKGVLGVLAVAAIVAIIASLATVAITGNVIKVQKRNTGTTIYTKAEIDSLMKQVGRGCEYIGYKDNDLNGDPMDGKTIWEACQKYNLEPKITTRYLLYTLHNRQDCSPSYTIFNSNSHLLGRAGSGDILGGEPTKNCVNAKFNDGNSNGNFSEETSWFIDGVICCTR